jgi:flagellar protein FlaG
MSNSVSTIPASSDSTYNQPPPQGEVAPVAKSKAHSDDDADAADLRLVIEDDDTAGSHLYKIIDSRTGAVVQQLEREEVLRLREAQSYAAGQVIKTRA